MKKPKATKPARSPKPRNVNLTAIGKPRLSAAAKTADKELALAKKGMVG